MDPTPSAIIEPGSEGYDAARQAFNTTVDQRPAAIAEPRDAAGVAAAVRTARERGLRVAPQTTGHSAGPLGPLDDALLLKTSALRSVEIDEAACLARVGAGARWDDVVPRASELALAAQHGSSPDVGIAGYTLGGGLGWYARKHGLACNKVTAIEMVTAAGEHVRATRGEEHELFWALRGGGGNFGVVTSLELELFALESLYAGALFFGWERSAEVLHAWREWTLDAPEEVTSVGRILQFPPFPEIPEPMRGNSFVVVEAAFLGDEAEGADLMRPLRELGPVVDTFATVPPAGISELHMDPREPAPALTGHALYGDLPPAAIDGLVDAAGPESGSPLVSVELRHGGGAIGRAEPDHGALAALPGSYAMFAVGIPVDPEVAAAVKAQTARLRGALAPYEAGAYLNFAEEVTEPGRFFGEATLGRLRAVKAEYDPENVIRSNHPLG